MDIILFLKYSFYAYVVITGYILWPPCVIGGLGCIYGVYKAKKIRRKILFLIFSLAILIPPLIILNVDINSGQGSSISSESYYSK
ncbi:hypothetical protein Xish_03624 [Xenorhabdus ishibashii]|uniref:Uncharacterized protein n=1 Tax=Xenorhabdus ishibashii TaxID=1034471 RepID=A0A2D0K7T3_9GAMM|nr:hypothetical protein Xish_03624 [Xenorhabdus ishibashii]